MSAPFYTSEHQSGENIDWNDLDTRKFPESIVNSCPGLVVRVWVKEDTENSSPKLVTVWAVYFNGLVYLGSQPPKEAVLFTNNALIFGMSWGFFTAENSLKSQIVCPLTQQQDNTHSKSYNVASMCRIHRMQRAIYKEGAESERLKLEIQSVQSNPSRYRNKSMRSISSLSASPTDLLALQEMRAKRQVALARVSMLQQERSRQLKSLEQLKETLKNLRVDNHTRALHLKEEHFHLQMDKDRLAELVKSLASTEEQDTRLKHQLVARRRQLFLELVEIFPIVQVKPGVYSINDVILPNSDSFAGFDDIQLSVALGHVTHLVQMLSVFLQVPNRYPVAVFSSRSRIIDNVSQREADAQKEFPLFAKGKDRLYFEYAVYLLNKDIAQLRWLCGLNTTDLAATLPNLYSLLQNLITPSSDESKMKRSDSRERGFTPRSHSMASASHYLFKSAKWQPHRLSRSLAGSQMSLADPSMASTVSLDNLTDSPQAGGYFRQPPSQQQIWNNHSSSTLSLDLVVDRLEFSASSPLLSSVGSVLHGSAPDLRSPESEALTTSPSPPPITFEAPPAPEPNEVEKIALSSSPITISQPNPLDMDDGMDSVTSRTEALAISSTFKLRGRGRTTSNSSQGNF
ncbi:hypothetical protein DAPPUDRAFT_321839 [Daphnia pulex]|uniref:UV radiation resistance-associated gene protein n=1 Tax=Daphnia pulex TaxID=6669 RepID=E9GU26_DAPPU|nr:hypothetical protein DAPPUDRAFT_321839 [Daphnia pulex]|eukprot:EFX76963.1 hypothetical protein DAPPUDRAFT_321839 [Daphnia pulex]